ncbi:MAG: hypothetical protein HND44_07290 [Chloroflexi bacterium]|nr:hypothetical protein [Ardenticatenaceae bacterium]NOG34366.1 hypothetical protein [Chloroflexota bacterium]
MMNSLLTYALLFLAVLMMMSIPSAFVVMAAAIQSARLSRAEENACQPLQGR